MIYLLYLVIFGNSSLLELQKHLRDAIFPGRCAQLSWHGREPEEDSGGCRAG